MAGHGENLRNLAHLQPERRRRRGNAHAHASVSNSARDWGWARWHRALVGILLRTQTTLSENVVMVKVVSGHAPRWSSRSDGRRSRARSGAARPHVRLFRQDSRCQAHGARETMHGRRAHAQCSAPRVARELFTSKRLHAQKPLVSARAISGLETGQSVPSC